MSQWKEFRDNILSKNPETRAEYQSLGTVYDAIVDVIRLRHLHGLSQEQLARKMGKQQPAIARLEAGRVNPSIAFLEQVANALDARLIVRLESKAKRPAPSSHITTRR
jgi:ribosome-binding protein aMBF1 (putative translation factor)